MLYGSSVVSPVSNDWQIQGHEPSSYYSADYLEFSIRTACIVVCARNEEMIIGMKTCYDDNFLKKDCLNSQQTVKTKKFSSVRSVF